MERQPSDAELSYLWDDTDARRTKTAMHELGHATAAWSFHRAEDGRPFEVVRIETTPNEWGVVPGEVEIDWTSIRPCSPVVEGAIVLAGLFAQEEAWTTDPDDWADLIQDQLFKNSDCTTDIEFAMQLAQSANKPWGEFCRSVFEALVQIHPNVWSRLRGAAVTLCNEGSISYRNLETLLAK